MDDPRWLDQQERDAWISLAGLVLLLPGQLEEALQPHGLSFFEYSMMAGLSDAPDRTVPMSTLAGIANGSLSRLSHAAKRLEKRGWLERHPSPDDGRVTLATLTDEGQAKMVAVAPDHVESVRRTVFDALSPEQVARLGEIAGVLLDHVTPKGFGPPSGRSRS